MLSNISKAEEAELAKKTRTVASMPKESLKKKRKALVTITQAPTEQDEETTSGLVFKRKRKTAFSLLSTLTQMGHAPPQDVIFIQ